MAGPATAVTAVASPRFRKATLIRLALMVVFLGWRFVDISGASGHVPGRFDPRGFKPLLADAETGDPLRFNVCEPIHYVINPALAPEGGVEDVHRAFEITARATGARLVFDGTTDEPYGEREAYQPDRYGDRWAPILVTWADRPLHDESPSSPGSATVGLGGPIVYNDGSPAFVSGMVVLDATADIGSGFGGATWGQVILHELGHVFGLAHIDDQTSVMYPELGLRPADFGQGDRQGLWALGIGSGCIKTPEVPWL